FGIDNALEEKAQYSPHASNYKLSDVHASFLLAYLEEFFDRIVERHREIYRIYQRHCPPGYRMFPHSTAKESPPPVCSTICLLSEATDVNPKQFPFLVRKYYKPLEHDSPVAADYYRRIVCIPCNLDLNDQ